MTYNTQLETTQLVSLLVLPLVFFFAETFVIIS